MSASTSNAMPARQHFPHTGAADQMPTETTVGSDASAQGIPDALPAPRVIPPYQTATNNPLTDASKRLNQAFSRGRVIVENTLGQFKHLAALSHRCRHSVDKDDDVFRCILAAGG